MSAKNRHRRRTKAVDRCALRFGLLETRRTRFSVCGEACRMTEARPWVAALLDDAPISNCPIGSASIWNLPKRAHAAGDILPVSGLYWRPYRRKGLRT